MSTTGEDTVRKGSCSCGSLSWAVTGQPLFSVYCHCTQCQRADGAAFVCSMHYKPSAFTWTHTPENAPDVENLKDFILYRCKSCRSCAATTVTSGNWALRASQLERDENGKVINWEGVKPTSHIFYGTRLVDVADDLPKWDGYAGSSNRL